MPAKTTSVDAEKLRQQLNTQLSKLTDRDTESQALSSLSDLILSLPASSLPVFLSSLSSVSPSSPPPLRRHSLRLISLISSSNPSLPSSLLPLLLSLPIRLLRDPDSQVRASLLLTIRSLSPLFPLSSPLLRPLLNSLLQQQETLSQSTAALAIAAALDSSTAPDVPGFVHKALPKLVKLYRSNGFRAKAAMLTVLGSGVAVGGVDGDGEVLGSVVGLMVEGTGSEEWSVRKAAAESLAKVGVAERDMLGGWRDGCVSTFEKRRFDKVKIVREEMNKMLEVWKDIPEVRPECTDVLPVAGMKLLSNPDKNRDGASGGGNRNAAVLKRDKVTTSRSPPPSASPVPVSRKNAPSVRRKILSPPLSRKNDQKHSNWIAESETPGKEVSGEKLQNVGELGADDIMPKLEVRRMLFQKNCEEKREMLAETKFTSNDTLQKSDSQGLTPGDEIKADELQSCQKDGDLSSIQKQLMQIENQQSSILDLLQKFIGNSQDGIHSLETRVNGLEKALDNISRDFALSSGRIYNETAANTCCGIPGAEFLSPKFWRKSEVKYSSRFSVSDMEKLTEKDSKSSFKWGKHKHVINGEIVTNPLAEISPLSRTSTDISTSTVVKGVIHDDRVESTCGRV